MGKSTLTSKGQTTIPKDIREHLGISVGDEIDFIIQDDGQVVVKPHTLDFRSLRGKIKSKKKLSIQDINKVISERFK
jgi:antitoxin PrlF